MASSPHTIELLLADADWVRSLAHRLVGESNLAEDAAQETWVAALERGPANRANLRAWLATVTHNVIRKSRRTETRRKTREEAVAREEWEPSTLEIVERFSTQHSVATAVLALDEPLREAILLRYYEDLTLAQIAERTGVAISTVKGRLDRGLGLLRGRLDEEHGGDGHSWAVALLPILQHSPWKAPGSGALAAPSIGVALFSLLVVTLAAVGWRALWTTQPANSVVHVESLRETPESGAPSGATHERALASGIAQAQPLPDGNPGQLVVRITTQSDDPVAGVLVGVSPEDTSRSDYSLPALRTGMDGTIRIDALRPGVYGVAFDRASSRRVRVRPGVEARVDVRLPFGPAVHGFVVDDNDAPIPDAEVWLSGEESEHFGGGRRVPTVALGAATRTDADGHFSIRSAGDAIVIGARAPGFAPSSEYRIDRNEARQFALRIVLSELGGSLEGTVFTPEGTPARGALLFLDANGDKAHHVSAISDPDGRFRFHGVLPGERVLQIRAPGLALTRVRPTVRGGESTELRINLQHGMRVTGKVLDGNGKPLEDLLVFGAKLAWVAPPDMRYATVTRTARDGSYELQGQRSGACYVTVQGRERGNTTEMVFGSEGSTLEHDIRLEPGALIRGTVVDATGAPLSGCSVHVGQAGAHMDPLMVRESRTDDAGFFEFTGCGESTHHVLVREMGFTVLTQRVEPGEDLRLVVPTDVRPTARVSGALVLPSGEPVRSPIRIGLTNAETGNRLRISAESQEPGAFRSKAVPPGRYRVVVTAEGHPDIELEEAFQLAPYAAVDLGVLTLARVGTLTLELEPSPKLASHEIRVPSHEIRGLSIQIIDEADKIVRAIHVSQPDIELPLSFRLPVGAYRLNAWARGLVPVRTSVRVVHGQTAVHRIEGIENQNGHGVALVLSGGKAGEHVRLLVSTQERSCVLEAEYRLGKADRRVRFNLPMGEYTFEAKTRGGRRSDGRFTVASNPSTTPAPPVLIRLDEE